MTEAALSSAEYTLENQRIGGLQIRVALLCTLVQICDGYDVGSIGWAVPPLTHAWNLPPPAFALAFLWSSVGVVVGAPLAAPIGDRFGRRPLILASVLIVGAASLLTAFAGSIGMLSVWRFFTGLGLGGAFASAATLTGDYAPRRLRATLIMASFTGAPLGGFIGGLLVSLLLARGFGWSIIFVLGGVFPLALLPILALWLPESPRFLATKGTLSPRQSVLLQRLDISPGRDTAEGVDLARGNLIKMLFSQSYALQTMLLWIVYFCSLMNLFLFVYWLPEVLHLIGLTPAQAVFATTPYTLGGVCAVLYLGVLIDRFGPERALALHYALGAGFIALIALVVMPYVLLLAAIFFAGLTIIGSQTGLNGTCGKLEEITPYLRAIAARRLSDLSDAEDAVQDVVLTLHAIRHTYDPTRPFGPWLVAISNRRLIDRLRRRGRLRSRETALMPEHETFPAGQTNLYEQVGKRRDLREAVDKLPARQRQAIRLLKLEERSLKEAAAMSGMTIASLKVATHRAFKKLRKILVKGDAER